ncbi:tetraacyldisaccharide 4'-kinase, partial [Succinivibrio sp.]
GFLLPAGPLREGEWRLDTADIVVTNGNPAEPKSNYQSMHLVPSPAVSLESFCSNQGFHDYLQKGTQVVALAGIGNPNRFYNTLKSCGYNIVSTIDTGDHGVVSKQTLINNSQKFPIVMTAKDAVKYADYKLDNLYVLNVEAVLPEKFYQIVASKLYDLTTERFKD